MANKKRYGRPYGRRHLLRRGDIKTIAREADYSSISVSQQMAGIRKMHPTVQAIADKIADKRQAIIDK